MLEYQPNIVLSEQDYDIVGKRPIRPDGIASATRPCGSKGIGGCDAFMKLCLSSSRCESCPAKGEPARAGSQPCAGRGDTAGDA